MRTAFFIDGYNLFYGLLAGTGYKWLDLPSLLSSVARIENPAFEPISFHYFTSPVQPKLSTRGIQSKEAQDTYIRALKAKGVEVILGRHRQIQLKLHALLIEIRLHLDRIKLI